MVMHESAIVCTAVFICNYHVKKEFTLDRNYFKRSQIVYKSKMEFLDEFSEREVVVLKKIFLQLKYNILSEIYSRFKYIILKDFSSNYRVDDIQRSNFDVDQRKLEKAVFYYFFLERNGKILYFRINLC